MRVVARQGREDIATVYISETDEGKRIEFVESLAPPIPREDKWVGIVSTLFGCPVRCPFCDAGNNYQGKLSKEEIIFQIDFLVNLRYPDRIIPVKKWKVQFARMGEPAYNSNVLDVLRTISDRYAAPGLMPCISTIAPRTSSDFFKELLEIKRILYPESFQFQYSVHSTDADIRRQLIPVATWGFAEMAEYGERFFNRGNRKIALNFALIDGVPVSPDVLREYFDPEIFIIKMTPLNPTMRAIRNNYKCGYNSGRDINDLVNSMRDKGYEVILSIGELEENAIGSNCGQYVSSIDNEGRIISNAYLYKKEYNSLSVGA